MIADVVAGTFITLSFVFCLYWLAKDGLIYERNNQNRNR